MVSFFDYYLSLSGFVTNDIYFNESLVGETRSDGAGDDHG
jgi:hypothetical protein